MINKIAQRYSQSQSIVAQSNLQLFESPIQKPLKKFTQQTYQKLEQRKLTLDIMSLQDLESYLYGLSLYKQINTHVRDVVQGKINEKKMIKNKETIEKEKANKRKAATTVEKAANWWAAMGIIFICLLAIITGGTYTLIQILLIQSEWLKWLLLSVFLGVLIYVFVLICTYVWPRRNIKQFERLFEEQKQKGLIEQEEQEEQKK